MWLLGRGKRREEKKRKRRKSQKQKRRRGKRNLLLTPGAGRRIPDYPRQATFPRVREFQKIIWRISKRARISRDEDFPAIWEMLHRATRSPSKLANEREKERERERERERKKKIGLIILIVDGLKRLDIVRNHTNEDKAFASTVPLKPSNSECAFPVRARCLSSIAPLAIVLPVLSCQWAEENHRGEEGKPVDSSSPWQLAWTILPVSLPSWNERTRDSDSSWLCPLAFSRGPIFARREICLRRDFARGELPRKSTTDQRQNIHGGETKRARSISPRGFESLNLQISQPRVWIFALRFCRKFTTREPFVSLSSSSIL